MRKLKILPVFFEDVIEGKKKAEIRIGDFKPNDYILLQEWIEGNYTGRDAKIIITHVCDYNQPKGQYVLSFNLLEIKHNQ